MYKDFPPYSYVEKGRQKGIDIDLARALAEQLSVSAAVRLVGADENVEDDLRNNVWKGHYLGGGVADVMLHTPFDRHYAQEVDQVNFIAPYQTERLMFAIDTQKLGQNPTIAAFATASVGVELDTLSDFYLLRASNGRIAQNVKHYPNVPAAVAALKAGEIAAVMGPRGEIEGALQDRPEHIVIRRINTPGLMRDSWAMGLAVKARHQALTDALAQAMAKLVQNGRVAEIFARYGATYEVPAQP